MHFLETTMLMMNVIPILTRLNLLFQNKDMDMSLVGPSIAATFDALQKLLDNTGTFESKLMDAVGEQPSYKGVKIVNTVIQRMAVQNTRKQFIAEVLSNLEKRFPAECSDVVNMFSVLSLKGVRFAGPDDIAELGCDKITTLSSEYGQ